MSYPKILRLAYFYPEHLNLYGDRGNILCLINRAAIRGIQLEVTAIRPANAHQTGSSFDPERFDFIFMGGGQDHDQGQIYQDFLTRSPQLQQAMDAGCVGLFICGAYQLLGKYYLSKMGQKLDGLSFFDAVTLGKDERLVGHFISRCRFGLTKENFSGSLPHEPRPLPHSPEPGLFSLDFGGVKTPSSEKDQSSPSTNTPSSPQQADLGPVPVLPIAYPEDISFYRAPLKLTSPGRAAADPSILIGFENHSGHTNCKSINPDLTDPSLDEDLVLAEVLYGHGNNSQGIYEGIRHRNFFGTYMHGSILALNPAFADYLLWLALERHGVETLPGPQPDDTLVILARRRLLSRHWLDINQRTF